MKRSVVISILSLMGLLVIAPADAARSGPGSGQIVFADTVGCGFSATTSDGVSVAAFGTTTFTGLKFIGGTSFADPRVGWICEGSVAGQDVALPSTGSLVITGLTCTLITFPPFEQVELQNPGTVILHANGDVKTICPPSTRG